MSDLDSLDLTAAIVGIAAMQSARSALQRHVIDPLADTAAAAAGAASSFVDDALARAAALPAGIVESLPEISALLGFLSPHGASVAAPPTDAAWEQGMGQSSAKAGHDRPESWTAWQTQIDAAGMVRWLRERYPAKTATHVAADLGAPVDTVAKWLAREALPNGRMLVLMICVYGPEFLAALLHTPPDWLQIAATEQDQRRLEAKLAAVKAQLADHRRWRLPGLTSPEGAP
ncbi:hypothetical protein [Methylobacterium isbiliense]|uniref:HTH cro/C1-type domain-containing protein n=1 Tax=Methylobacterium isbiliense TaxID=315478 RepID=A0ABQ4SKA9_9HYPH|nr:hypothetical protein [Methylobacterium isbiliense]MDN3627148.1 hypothetical protein [Methylobacterium isbiliense]GJE03597.1 hypothetical protein GMJLKIPL_5554 [Methylobacterium isbiliense]